MKGKRKVIKESNDLLFIMEAVKNGDQEAIKIFQLSVDINKLEIDIKENHRSYSNEVKLKLLNNWRVMKINRDSMLWNYNINYKRAKNYLDTLKRKKQEEKTNNKKHHEFKN
jgi:predicted transcriptional regulator